MKLGLIARADRLGLGSQTYGLYTHLKPARTLVVDMRHHNKTGVHDFHLYHRPWDILRDDQLCEGIWERFLDGLDVVLTAETPYDYGLYVMASKMGVRTVCHTNPEFYKHAREPALPKPDITVLPTTWLADIIPHDAVLPTPVDRKRFAFSHRIRAKRFVHIAGHRAMADRNGTQVVMQAARHITSRVHIRYCSQVHISGNIRSFPRGATTEVVQEDLDDPRQLYEGFDVLLFPRRYAGQALAINEALSCGLPVLTLDRDPERSWGGVLTCESRVQRQLRTQSGKVDLYAGSPRTYAQQVDRLAKDPDLVAELSKAADAHAQSISWEVLRDDWLRVLEGHPERVRYRV